MQRSDHFQYRPWIDGLRAVAVILVILDHYFGLLPAGYTGVDMFFVISGFLVGGIIYEQVLQQQFSLRDFYIKRLHRIVPAQLFMIALLFIALHVLYLPEEIIERFTKEVIYAVTSISNYYYWNSIGYFDIDSFRKFLLHTWSLAVEEQFYLVFPILLLLLTRFKRYFGLLLFSCFAMSLAANFSPSDEPSKFYLLPFRFWEFLAGFGVYYISVTNRLRISLSRIAGYCALFLLALLQVNPFHFSGPALIISTAICFSVLFFCLEQDAGSVAIRVFAWRPLRYIGKTSYSLYLAHWPVMVVMRLKYNVHSPSAPTFLLYLFTTFCLALLSYYLVEKRFRITGVDKPGRKMAYGAVFILLLMAGTASFIAINKPYSLIGTRSFTVSKYPLPGCGELIVEASVTGHSLPVIVCWGDSHAGMLSFRDNRFSKRYNIYKIYSTGCPPFFNTAVKTECGCNDQQKINTAWKKIKSLNPAYVVLASRFSIYINGLRINNVLRKGNHFISSDSTKNIDKQEERETAFAYGLNSTIDSLKSLPAKILIMKQVPDFANFHNPESLVSGGVYSVPAQILFQPLLAADAIIDQYRSDPAVRIFDPRGFFKGDRGFLVFDKINNRLLYKDDSHLSPTGALRVTDPLMQVINNWK